MVVTLSIREVRRRWEELLERVMRGDEVVITQAGEPIARLTQAKRVPGIDKGKVWISDDFDTMSPEELSRWYNSGSTP